MNPPDVLGFIGTGVMGEPMCRNLAQKSGRRVAAWDLQRAPLESLCETALLPAARAGLTLVDLGTSGVGRTRELARRFAECGADYADAPVAYPERAFSVEYAAKDNGYALELGREAGVRLRGAETVAAVFEEARSAGFGGAYYPVIAKVVER